jgi:uncharacterized protein (TIGR03066 family)
VRSPTPNQPKDEQAPGTKYFNGPGLAAARVRRLSPRLKTVLLGLVCMALSALATFSAFEIFAPVRLPAAMRGKWVVVEGKGLRGAVLEFFADGRMVGTVQTDGKEVTINGRVEVQGNHFRVTTGPTEAVQVTEPEEILELTDRWFVVQDSRGEILIMERLQGAGAAAAGGVR